MTRIDSMTAGLMGRSVGQRFDEREGDMPETDELGPVARLDYLTDCQCTKCLPSGLVMTAQVLGWQMAQP